MHGLYCFGRFVIDQQHAHLQRMANKLQVLVEQNASSEDIHRQFVAFSSQLGGHFDDEEGRLISLGLPAEIISAHTDDHRRIMAEVTHLCDTDCRDASLPGMSTHLEHWVSQHMEVYDRPLANFLKG